MDTAALIKDGGVVVLAFLVWLELRAQRPILRSLEKVAAALLERERMRSGAVVQPPELRDLRAPRHPQEWPTLPRTTTRETVRDDGDTTPPDNLPRPRRARSRHDG